MGKTSTLPEHGDIILNSTNQTRGECNSLVWAELTFKGYADAIIPCLSIFIFHLEPAVRKELHENNFHHYYGFFYIPFWKYVTSSFTIITKHFDNGNWNDTLQLKILQTWFTIWTNFFLGKYTYTKIDKGAWKIIIYKVIRACSSNNIAPRNFTYLCFFFSQINLV